MKRVAVVGNPGGWSSEALADAVAERTGFRCLVDPALMRLDLVEGRVVAGDVDLTGMDGIVIRKLGLDYAPEQLDRLEMLRFAAMKGVPVFSAPRAIAAMLDRLACTVTLRSGSIPMPDTMVTQDVNLALEAIRAWGTAVLKPLFSTKARGMLIVKAGPAAREEVGRFRASGHPVLYVQKLIELPGQDLGVAFIAGRYVGTYSRVGSGGSWNTTVMAGGRYSSFEPPHDVIELARKASALFGLDYTSVDVALGPDGPVVFEVSAFGGCRGLWEGCGIDAPGMYADYVLGRIDHG